MRLVSSVGILVVITILGCKSATAPSAANGFLTGTWCCGVDPPCGASTVMSLHAASGYVDGTIRLYDCPADSRMTAGTIQGVYSGGGVTLDVSVPAGGSGTYVGHLTDAGVLEGTFTPSASPQSPQLWIFGWSQ
jgi:hypothetical protein